MSLTAATSFYIKALNNSEIHILTNKMIFLKSKMVFSISKSVVKHNLSGLDQEECCVSLCCRIQVYMG